MTEVPPNSDYFRTQIFFSSILPTKPLNLWGSGLWLLIFSIFVEGQTANSPLSLSATARWGHRNACELFQAWVLLLPVVWPHLSHSPSLGSFSLSCHAREARRTAEAGYSLCSLQDGSVGMTAVRPWPGGRRAPEPPELPLCSLGRLEQGCRVAPACRQACPSDFSPWGVSPAGEADPVHHGPPERHQEGDRGEPLPVSRAAVGQVP